MNWKLAIMGILLTVFVAAGAVPVLADEGEMNIVLNGCREPWYQDLPTGGVEECVWRLGNTQANDPGSRWSQRACTIYMAFYLEVCAQANSQTQWRPKSECWAVKPPIDASEECFAMASKGGGSSWPTVPSSLIIGTAKVEGHGGSKSCTWAYPGSWCEVPWWSHTMWTFTDPNRACTMTVTSASYNGGSAVARAYDVCDA